MIRAFAGAAFALWTGWAMACPAPSETVLFHSCWGTARTDLLLMPEDQAALNAPGQGLVVTGAYTGKDARDEGLPKPVGLFIAQGRLVNRNMARMDGILLIGPDGRPELYHRNQVALDAQVYDLTDLNQRGQFLRAAAAAGISVMQSHLLVVEGGSDVSPSDDAPVSTRRLFFTDRHGYGIWQSTGALTLHDTAKAAVEALAPRQALNLDMGSFDYCMTQTGTTRQRCGAVALDDLTRFSNLLALRLE
ncbi:MAG: hypothetical protein AAF713_14275 [Pseudomonadota bacterium]